MLPLSDRVLLRLRVAPRTVRELAWDLDTDVYGLHRVLRGLAEAGAIEPMPPGRGPVAWRLAPHVRVEHRPASLAVRGLRRGARTPEAHRAKPTCTGMTDHGRPCREEPGPTGRCYKHFPEGEGVAEA